MTLKDLVAKGISGVKAELAKSDIDRKQRKYAEDQIKKKAKAEYYQVKEQESLKVAREKAKYEAKQQITALKAQKPTGGGAGIFGGSISFNPNGSLMGGSKKQSNGMFGPSMFGPSVYGRPAKQVKKRKRKSTNKTVTVVIRR